MAPLAKWGGGQPALSGLRGAAAPNPSHHSSWLPPPLARIAKPSLPWCLLVDVAPSLPAVRSPQRGGAAATAVKQGEEGKVQQGDRPVEGREERKEKRGREGKREGKEKGREDQGLRKHRQFLQG